MVTTAGMIVIAGGIEGTTDTVKIGSIVNIGETTTDVN
jgi:hypothetical protein